jgi:lipopolysaccharide/colanic/teichoic acid biosynthesis glycosyltransferase
MIVKNYSSQNKHRDVLFQGPTLTFDLQLTLGHPHGPIFFRQQRAVARGSKAFIFYKFRTMVKDADHQKNHLYDQNESNGALFKIRDDHA